MALMDGNAKFIKMLINNYLQNNVNGSVVEGQPKRYSVQRVKTPR
jgi:hypothetical protein